jgi:hypothetical protein
MADWTTTQISFDPNAKSILDRAEGILIGLRRCPSEAALGELLGAAQRHRVPVFTIAWALVHLASGTGKSSGTFHAAQSAARHEWGGLLTASAARPLESNQHARFGSQVICREGRKSLAGYHFDTEGRCG